MTAYNGGMKKLMVLVLSVAGFAFAADIPTVIETARPLVGAVDAPMAYYLPGFGVSITKSELERDFDVEAAVAELTQIVSSLAPLVQGLEPGDYVDVTLMAFGSGFETVYLSVRVKPDQTDSLEVWVNGEKR